MLKKLIMIAIFLRATTSFAYDHKALSLEEKVGQLLLVHFSGEEVSEEAKKLVGEVKVGGIIYFSWANGLNSTSQVRSLSENLQKLSTIPLWIAVDQEGGVVGSLKEGFTEFAGNKALAMTGDTLLAKEVAFCIGKELRSVGINMNFAPVVDVNVNPKNPTIGLRSFGETADEVAVFGKEMLDGYHAAHIFTTLKHFPGHGDVLVDSHDRLPIVNKSQKELEQVELLPFAKLSSLTDAIMTAHILVPALDETKCATLSSSVLGYLRHEIGFSGLIISDSLIMKGALAGGISVEESAIQALEAGCDLLVLGGKLFHSCEQCELFFSDIKSVHQAIVQSVKQGRLSEARIDESVERSLRKKEQYLASLVKSFSVDEEAHRTVAQKVAKQALNHTAKDPVVLQGKKIGLFAPSILQKNLSKLSFFQEGSSQISFFCQMSPSQEEIEESTKRALDADVLFVCSYNAWKNPSQILWIESLMSMGKPVVLWVTRDPLDATLFPMAAETVLLHSPTFFSLQAARDLYLQISGGP